MEDVLPKLRDIDVERLSGGATTRKAAHRVEAVEQLAPADAAPVSIQPSAGVPRKNDLVALDAARERYLARKAGRQPGSRR